MDLIVSSSYMSLLLKSIERNAFENCKELIRISFSENSELISIGEYALTNSSIKDINIPSKVEMLKEGWRCNTPNLINVVLSPKNKDSHMLMIHLELAKISLMKTYQNFVLLDEI